MGTAESYAELGSRRGLEPVHGFAPGPVTPLLTKGGGDRAGAPRPARRRGRGA